MILASSSRHIGSANNNPMKTQSSSHKSIIGAVVIFGALALGYFYFSGNKPVATDSLLQANATPEANVVSSRILNLLNQIRTLKIDTSIFKDPAYQSLVDYSVSIPPVDVGRPNPFAPIPGVIDSTTPSSTVRAGEQRALRCPRWKRVMKKKASRHKASRHKPMPGQPALVPSFSLRSLAA